MSFRLTGSDLLLADSALVGRLRKSRVGLLTHDACRIANGTPTRRALARALGTGADRGLCRLFTPEHGLSGSFPAGSAVPDKIDEETGIPVISLYGTRKRPAAETLCDLDVLLIDLRDVGVRCFTYAATAAHAIEATDGMNNLEIIVCDRPNPLGPHSHGPPLDPELRSLVAWFDVPFVHGRTIGNLLSLAAARRGVPAPGVIAPPESSPTAIEDSWIPPSPALDHPDAVLFYPGLVLLEGTNLNEGRGTTAPFRSVSAPWLDPIALAADIANWHVPIIAEPGTTTPRTGRYAERSLPALIFRPDDSATCDGLAFGVRLLCAIAARHEQFNWTKSSGNDTALGGAGSRYFIDALLGSRSLREFIDSKQDAETILESWSAQADV